MRFGGNSDNDMVLLRLTCCDTSDEDGIEELDLGCG